MKPYALHVPPAPTEADPAAGWQNAHALATALRDLSGAAAIFEQNPSAKNREALNRANDYAEALLESFAAVEGDIRPEYQFIAEDR